LIVFRGTAVTATELGTINDYGSILLDNVAILEGGAGYMDDSGVLNLQSTLIQGNSARYGGAVAVSDLATKCPSLNQSRILENTAVVAGGVIYFGGNASPCFNYCPGCSVASSNKALYGSIQAGRAARLRLANSLATQLTPSEIFEATLELLDEFNQVRDL